MGRREGLGAYGKEGGPRGIWEGGRDMREYRN